MKRFFSKVPLIYHCVNRNLTIKGLSRFPGGVYITSQGKQFSDIKTLNLCEAKNDRIGHTLRFFYTSEKRLEKKVKDNESEKKTNANRIVYYGALTGQIKGVKVFTCVSSLGGIVLQPMIIQNILQGDNLPIGIAICTTVGFFTFVTPLLIHLLTKKYVTEISYDPATETYTATTLSFFLRKISIHFRKEDVTVPSLLPIFTTMCIKDKAVFVVSDSFIEIEHYIRMMGYDKPIDLKLDTPIDELDKDFVEKINYAEKEKAREKSKAV